MGWVLFFGILGAFFMLFFMLFTMDPATGEVSAMGIVFSSAAFVLFLWVYLRFHKDDRQIEEKRYSEERAAFYDECIKNGVKSCESEKEIQKATLIAQKMGFTFTDITALFAESKECKENIEQKKKEDALEEQRNEERQKCALLTRYASYFGREKRIAMLSDERKKYMESAETLRSGADALLSASQFKEEEGNWAIMGGAASALAGPAAGMAAAISSQAKTAQKNAQIRAQNQRNLELFAPVAATYYSGAARKGAIVKHLAEQIEAAKTKLVADDSSLDCFERLHFEDTTVEVSQTGTCTVKTKINIDPFIIFDDVPAVIDGAILAEIYDGDELLGTAQMVLPVYGVKVRDSALGMALFCGHVGGKYSVKFCPGRLWAMER